jgi:hypothetical protein
MKTLMMDKDDIVASFFTKISQIRDPLLLIGVPVDDDDLVQIVVDGLPPSWEVFLDSGASRHMIGSKDNLSNFKNVKFSSQVELGYDVSYAIKGIVSTS